MFSIESNIKDFPKSTGKRYKVIVNAGGGIFGYIITNLMSYLNFDLYSKVDAVSGTSIGGILSMAYALDDHYGLTNNAFKQLGSKIFSEKNYFYWFRGTKYKNKYLQLFLNKLFGNKKLSDITKTNIIITSTDFTLTQPRIFENFDLKPEQDIELTKIGLCTSAAPTYFPCQELKWTTLKYDPFKIPVNEKVLLLSAFEQDKLLKSPDIKKSSVIFDGGLLENIPIISTYTTLHNALGVEPKDIDMFVIGTGDDTVEKTYSSKEIHSWSILRILKKLVVPYITDSNEQTSIFWGLQMGFNSFTYFNPVRFNGKLDDVSLLKNIEDECLKYKDEFISKINEFLNK